MKALVLGCGSIGRRHARNLASLDIDVLVHDVDGERALAAARDIDARAVERERAFADLVVVATPTVAHADDLEWALTRGSHVFVEKPLAATPEHLERAVVAARTTPDRHVMVGCNLRFTEGYRLLREQIAAGSGPPGALLIDFGWWLPAWRPDADYRTVYSARRAAGGGIILDAIHEIDYAISLAGPVTEVSSHWTRSGFIDVDVEDVADITLRHESGTQTHIHLDYLRRRYTRSCTAILPDADVHWDFAAGTVERVGHAGDQPQVLAANLDTDRNAAYVDEMRHLLACITKGDAPVNGVDEASAATAVALRAVAEGAP